MLTFFAQEHDSRVLCYANANLTRADQPGELMRFVEFWHDLTGPRPAVAVLRLQGGALRRAVAAQPAGHLVRDDPPRGAAACSAACGRLPAAAWHGAVIDTPKRRHQAHPLRGRDGSALPGYEGAIRQLAVDGLGREQPTLFLSNNFEETARSLIIRYAGRNRVEDGLGISVNFFHLDCLASEVRLNVDLDVALTVLANGCYRWLGRQLRGFEKRRASSCTASSWRPAGGESGHSGRIGSWSISTSVVITRSCARRRSTSRRRRSPGWGIGSSASPTRDPRQLYDCEFLSVPRKSSS